MNAQIREVSARFWADEGRSEVLCECGGADCVQRIELPAALYDEIAADNATFVVAPGHEWAGRDEVVRVTSRYSVVALAAPPRGVDRGRSNAFAVADPAEASA